MSKYCPKCGNVLNDDAVYCNKCGHQFSTQQNYQQQNYQQQNYQQAGGQQGYQQQNYQQGASVPRAAEIIVDSDEKVVMCLQNSYAQTMVTDLNVGSTSVFFTNKRFYAKENRFTLGRGLETKNTVVRLSEISGTQILHENPFQLFIWAGLIFLFGIIFGAIIDEDALIAGVISGIFWAGICTLLYFLRKGTYLLVSFPGDTVKIRVKMYNYNSVVTFLKGLQSYIAKIK